MSQSRVAFLCKHISTDQPFLALFVRNSRKFIERIYFSTDFIQKCHLIDLCELNSREDVIFVAHVRPNTSDKACLSSNTVDRRLKSTLSRFVILYSRIEMNED